MTFSQRLCLIILFLVGAAFVPITITLIIGMLPSIVAFLLDQSRTKTRALTVALMNFAACFPFLLEIGIDKPTMEGAYDTLLHPFNVMIMFAGAVVGFCLDWTLAGISSIIMTTRAKQRLEWIERHRKELVRRWGPEVTGEVELDPDGFPLEQAEQ